METESASYLFWNDWLPDIAIIFSCIAILIIITVVIFNKLRKRSFTE